MMKVTTLKVKTRVVALLLLLVSCFAVYQAAMAQELEEALTNHPNPDRAAYYIEHAEEIQALRAQAMEGEAAERVEALRQLALLYPDAAVTTAIELIDDDTLEVAVTSAELLAASIAMSNHSDMHHGDVPLLPYQEYMIERHEAARVALLGALEDARIEVRTIAATTLASLSDEEALAVINEGVEQGLYSDTEAVNYFGLANTAVGGPYIEPYLASGSTGARVGAVTYLGSVPVYQARVRDEVLFDPESDPSVRGSAAGILGVYDQEYPSYALILTLDPELPSDLYADVVDAYVSRLQADNEINPVIAGALQRAVDNYSARNADAGLENSRSIINSYLPE